MRKKVVFSPTVYLLDGKIYRKIEDIDSDKRIIEVLKKKNLIGTQIVNTRMNSSNNKFIHDYVRNIIHSGEFTESMTFDVTEHAINMALDLIEDKIYSWDLVPNNFTFLNGKWLLYDFGAFDTNPKHIKTQIRCLYKINFSSFELTKKIDRKYLKHFYLNRIKILDLLKMISSFTWIKFWFNLQYCLMLYSFGFYKQSYLFLNKEIKKYKKNHVRKYFEYDLKDDENELYLKVSELISSSNIQNCFCIGERIAKYPFENKDTSVNYFIYADDYDLCDRIYNSIFSKNYKNISTAVLYPHTNDENISEEYKYRALYDYYNQERFCSDAVLVFNIEESLSNNTKEYIKNISDFASKMLILKLDNSIERNLSEEIKSELENIWKNMNIHAIKNYTIIEAKNKKEIISQHVEYNNHSRMRNAKLHTKEILKILKSYN